MANNYFKFKQFTILQNHAAMKVGTDGVLLGAWADCSNTKTILDIGTGTGLIALMLAQRSNATIDAIDIDDNAIQDAELNISRCLWKNRIRLHKSRLQDYGVSSKYDLIVSNPPYFNQSYKANTESRTNARHDDELSPKDLLRFSSIMLNQQGRICVIIPYDNIKAYESIAATFNLHINKLLWIKPTPTKAPKRVLVEYSFAKLPPSEASLIVEDKGRHKYSNDYKKLTKDFYLNF